MNIIQLYVNDSGTGTPFVEGPNVIVIPTSLFTETVFNAYVQNETLSETPIYSADEDIFMFISVGRDGNTKQACEEIDFVFIRFEISSEDAMELLTLLLMCLVNETTNETAIVYSYVSTKLNDSTAMMMNLPFSVLGFIPWFCNFAESPMGSKPETRDDVFWKALKTLCSWTLGLIVMAIMIPAIIVAMLIVAVVTYLLENLPIFQYILWLIICAAILVFIWIMFVFTVLSFSLLFLQMSLIFIFFSIIIGIKPTINVNHLAIEVNDLNFNSNYKIGKRYNDFLKLEIPTLFYSFEVNQISYETYTNFFTDGPLIDLKFFESILLTQNNTILDTNEPSESWWNGASMIFGSFSLLESSNFALTLNIDNPVYELLIKVAFYLGLVSLTLGIMRFILDFPDKEKRVETFRGLIFASLFLFIVNCFITTLYHKGSHGGSGMSNQIKNLFKLGFLISFLGTGASALNSIMGFFGVNLGIYPSLSTYTSIISFIIMIIIAAQISKNETRRKVIRNWWEVSLLLVVSVIIFAIIILPFD